MTVQIPTYPVVHVNLQADGRAHLNVAGKHVDYPPAELEETRAAVIAYAVELAIRLGRAVRMTTTDPDGEWKLGVFPDGEVVDLHPAAAKGRGTARPSILDTQPPAPRLPPAATPPAIVVIDPAPVIPAPFVPPPLRSAPDVVPEIALETELEHDTVMIRHVPAPVASLSFSTGDAVAIGTTAIIGRKPQAAAKDPLDAQFVTLEDPERRLSRTHADVGWVGEKLMLTDRGAGNGTDVTRGSSKATLQAGKPYELHHGDRVHLGGAVTCTVTIGQPPRGATR